MKKLLNYSVPLAFLSGVLLFSCSHDELIERESSSSGVIGFSTAGNRFSTKMAPRPKEGDDMRSFLVWGYGSEDAGVLINLNGAEVSRTSSDAAWKYSPVQEWPADGTVDFYAVSPADAIETDDMSVNGSGASFTYTVPDPGDQVDLLAVRNTGVEAQVKAPVSLTFGHALSRIGLNVKTDIDVSGATFKISDVKLLNVMSTGTYTFETFEHATKTAEIIKDPELWSDQNTPKDYTAVIDDDLWSSGQVLSTTATAVFGGDGGLMVLPQTAAPGAYEVDTEPDDGGTYLSLTATFVRGGDESDDITHTFYFPVVNNRTDREPLEFEPGIQYTFELEFRLSADFNTFFIQFSDVTADAWQDSRQGFLDDLDYVEIAGYKWAKSNVDAPGIFAPNETDFGMLYQYGQNVGWREDLSSSPSDMSWLINEDIDGYWDMVNNNPCPEGWVVPTKLQLEALLTNDVTRTWVENYAESGKSGYTFTEGSKVLFLPEAYSLSKNMDWTTFEHGAYWCRSDEEQELNLSSMDYLGIDKEGVGMNVWPAACGFSVRCVWSPIMKF
jgi:uncharacterized protein (TIGR02145 family)